MTERGCYCGEFDCPTIAPDEFGETCFHEYDKCEVPPVQVPHSSVLKLAKARAERAEVAIQRVRDLHGRHDPNCPYGEDCAGAGLCLACREEYPCATLRALDGSNSPPVTSEITGPLIDPDDCVIWQCECPCHELVDGDA